MPPDAVDVAMIASGLEIASLYVNVLTLDRTHRLPSRTEM